MPRQLLLSVSRPERNVHPPAVFNTRSMNTLSEIYFDDRNLDVHSFGVSEVRNLPVVRIWVFREFNLRPRTISVYDKSLEALQRLFQFSFFPIPQLVTVAFSPRIYNFRRVPGDFCACPSSTRVDKIQEPSPQRIERKNSRVSDHNKKGLCSRHGNCIMC